MELSVAYNFEHGLIEKLSAFPQVTEIFGKLRSDLFGGGRSSYTLKDISHRKLRESVGQANRHGITFNYLLNAASLDGAEQTRAGQRRIRSFIEKLCSYGVGSVTVASPLLLRIIKKEFPQLRVRVGAFAVVDSAAKARAWSELGADTICLSALRANRDFSLLKEIRGSVSCGLQLIANSTCLPDCAWELTHMNLLTHSSCSSHRLGGFCLDYCFFHCALQRLQDPSLYLRGVWIRPEDLEIYERMGYTSFKIVERSSPGWLLMRRVEAYARRRFDGNLMELVAAVAQVKRSMGASLMQYLRMALTLARLHHVKLSSLMLIKKFAETVVPHQFGRTAAPVYIDNKKLDGFLREIADCKYSRSGCDTCPVCRKWTGAAVEIDEHYRNRAIQMANRIDRGIIDGSLW